MKIQGFGCIVRSDVALFQDLNFAGDDRFMVDQSSNETIMKGDTLIAEVMIITNNLLDIVTHSKMILGDGICLKLWTQGYESNSWLTLCSTRANE